MPVAVHSEFSLGDMVVRFLTETDGTSPLALSILPRSRLRDVVIPREFLDAPAVAHLPKRWQPIKAGELFPLIHVQTRQEPAPSAFAQGRTLLGGPVTLSFRLAGQTHEFRDGVTTIRTRLATPGGLVAIHELQHRKGENALQVQVILHNEGPAPVTIDLLTSFALDGITPFASDDAPDRLWIHRFRSAWSAEGRPEERRLEDLHLERSWTGYGVRAERFGQVGSMPTNGWFPQVVVEDRPAGVCWAARLAHPGSWQLELHRRGDRLGLVGGLADREFGHWSKHLAPGEALASPEAVLTVVAGTPDDACDRLSEPLRRTRAGQPAIEHGLPVVFNEWCTSWGHPTHDSLLTVADRLRDTGITYLVIDDGWAERPGDGIQQNGDWIVNRTAFPGGLKATADAIRQRGLVPGLWFEFEVVNSGAKAWTETAHQLHRDGVPLQVGTRRFWDFRDPWVHDYLANRVIGLLREAGIGYLKVDYNDTLGLGCDGAESLGEALRQHLEGVQRFFRRLRAELPELVIENCSSGGHRTEPSMMALTAMTSFSDAHETPDIPVIAANLQRVMLAEQNQIWAVLRKEDSLQRLGYSLAATFLGRMCLSGDIGELSPTAWSFVREAIRHYHEAAPLIAHGHLRRHGTFGPSYQHLTGWQAVVCAAPAGHRAMVVWHAFARPPASAVVPLPVEFTWRLDRDFSDEPSGARVQDSSLILPLPREWSGGIILLENHPLQPSLTDPAGVHSA